MESAKKLILVAILIVTSPSYAVVIPIHKGDQAPYDGFVFDQQSEREAAQFRIDALYYQKLSEKLTEKSELQDQENNILNARLQLYINESRTLAKSQTESETTQRLFLLGSFALGVLTTTLVFRNARP